MTTVIDLRCISCGAQYPLGAMHEGCPACATPSFRSGLTPGYDYSAGDPHGTDGLATHARVGGLWRYRDLLPVTDATFETGLGEGGTPLVPIPRLAEALGAREVLVKDESRNPTWSFKDRLAAVAVSKARELGAETVVAASSGNAGVSLAAYAAAARLPCIVLTYPGIPQATAMLIRSYGAHIAVTTKPGRWSLIREGMRDLGWYPLTNVTDVPTNSPYGHEGYKTIAYELFEQLHGRVPDYVAIPVSYCEGLFGIWKGFRELVTLGLASRVPRMLACEPAGGPLLAAHQRAEAIAQVKPPPTIARGVGASVNAFAGIHAVRHSEGAVVQADDSEIRSAQDTLAAEGLFVEPAAALGLAGLRAFVASSGVSLRDKSVVLVSTASGAKYAGPVQDEIAIPVELEEPTLNALSRALPHLDLGRCDR